ncbi:helix-turn-helix transcriptional regulator [Gemmobacter sp. LW-1]|uniref:helix-turn-helix transcriptional regulator n=1 Tax=Gemmobacter sp. LW-1 TaxID=1529005 RepID=UPI0006C74675|nr:helix-turn-helix transcriptional regulator [Gemmobacter sp. LW-1]
MKELGTYLKEVGVSQKAFADQLGVDPSVVSRFIARTARPGLELAVKIEDATEGVVTARSWVAPPPVEEDPEKDVA